MKVSNYSLNYSRLISQGEMDVFGFLELCRQLRVAGASLHVRDLPDTQDETLKRIRRAYVDQGLSISMFSVSTNFGRPQEQHGEELEKAREAIRVAAFLGAPLLRVFAGSPQSEADRKAAFERSAQSIRKVCLEASDMGLPVALQNHNHGALIRTGDEVVEFFKLVDHPNFTFMLDCGQFAGSPGASADVPPDLRDADYLESIRQTASLARYVRMKFYNPRADGSEPFLDYDRVFDILRGVHYDGFVDIVYEPGTGIEGPGEDIATAMPRIVAFLKSKIAEDSGNSRPAPHRLASRYAGTQTGKYFEDREPRTETSVVFLEGPAVDRAGNVFFTNIPAAQILKWDPKESNLSVFRENSGGANGLLFDRQGRLLACEGRSGRVTRTDMRSGEITVLAEEYGGHPLGGPNDLTADNEGRVYFTSRLENRDPARGNVNAVYRIDAPGKLARILALPEIDMPNGIVTSPDGKRLYLIDADGRENRARRVRAYDLHADGTVSNERTHYDFYPGRSGDGMCIDAEENLYVAAGLHHRRGTSETLATRSGIHVISPDGKLLAFVETPEDTITNCTFGGEDLRTLYVACGKRLLSFRTRIPGKAAYRPEA